MDEPPRFDEDGDDETSGKNCKNERKKFFDLIKSEKFTLQRPSFKAPQAKI